jgi:hypothetical protein
MSATDDLLVLDVHADGVGDDTDRRLDVSVVVPLKNEEASLEELFERVRGTCEARGILFEVVFVDDGSTDGSMDVLRALAARDHRSRYVQLRRNFGKAAALATGFRASRGAIVVTMDADLQDDPAEIPRFMTVIADGYDVVSGWKQERHDPLSRRLASRFFNGVTRKVSGVPLHDFNCGIKAYTGQAARDIADTSYGELHRYLPVIAHGRGYRVTEMVVQHHERKHGRSRYGLERYIRGCLDLVTVSYLTKYGRRPMHAFGGIALWRTGAAAALAAYAATAAVLGFPTGGALAPAAAVVLFVGGVQCGLAGIIAELLTRPDATVVPVIEPAPAGHPRPTSLARVAAEGETRP